jgi:hypothetical protein
MKFVKTFYSRMIVTRVTEAINRYTIFVGKPLESRPLRRKTDKRIQKTLCEDGGHSGHAICGKGLDRLNTGIVGSNPAQDMDVCPRLSVLSCPV